MLFQARPDVFPEGYLTDTEIALWGLYYDELDRARKTK
jgi:hypothetical protein